MPYNFNVAPVDPTQAFTGFMGSMNAGQQMAANQQAMDIQRAQFQQSQYAQQLALQKQAMASKLLGKAMGPDGTAEDWGMLASILPPEQMKAASDQFKLLNENEQQDRLLRGTQLWAAAKGGYTDVAQSLLDDMIVAESGKPGGGNAGTIAMYKQMRTGVVSNPDAVAAQIGMVQAGLPGGKDLMDAYYKQGSLGADNALKEAQASESPSNIAKNQAQANSYNAQAGLDTAKANSFTTGRLIDPKEIADTTLKLSDDYLKNTSVYQLMKPAFQKIVNANPNGIGDTTLIYGLIKILTPTEAVMQGDINNIAAATSLLDKLKVLAPKVETGDVLGPGVRKQILDQAKVLFDGAQKTSLATRARITKIANDLGIPTDHIFDNEKDSTSNEMIQGASAKKGSFNATAMTITKPDGTVLKYKDGNAYLKDLQTLQQAGEF